MPHEKPNQHKEFQSQENLFGGNFGGVSDYFCQVDYLAIQFAPNASQSRF